MSLGTSFQPHWGVVNLNGSAVFSEFGWKMLCEKKVFLCLIKLEKKDKVIIWNKTYPGEKKCAYKGDMSQWCQPCPFVEVTEVLCALQFCCVAKRSLNRCCTCHKSIHTVWNPLSLFTALTHNISLNCCWMDNIYFIIQTVSISFT